MTEVLYTLVTTALGGGGACPHRGDGDPPRPRPRLSAQQHSTARPTWESLHSAGATRARPDLLI